MNTQVRTLIPLALWEHFADLNAVPRGSKKEEKAVQFIKNFGEGLGLKTSVDAAGNVIIKKPASAGMENRITVALQGHLDMVHQKNAGTDFDFNTQGIEMLVEGDWVRANGTTLGADNGIGAADIMSILASKDIAHPPLEALFTIDEETGMTGAINLKGGLLDAEIMLNLDTEDDNELTIGCAGGVDVTATGTYTEEIAPNNSQAYRLHIKGLTGGHSGMDIHRGRGNANKLMNRVLTHAAVQLDVRVNSIDGGSLRNAIPRESFATIFVPLKNVNAFADFIASQEQILKIEYSTTDPNLTLSAEKTTETSAHQVIGKVLPFDFQKNLFRAIYACPNGIYRMSPDIQGLVQTSNNVARVIVKDGSYSLQCLTRSSVNSEKTDMAEAIKSAFELAGAKVTLTGAYPGWMPKPEAKIVKLMSSLYQELYHEPAKVNACHAGLECGILGSNYPKTEMISFGPNIRGAHSPDEKVQISSVQKFWDFLLETLKRIPEKKS